MNALEKALDEFRLKDAATLIKSDHEIDGECMSFHFQVMDALKLRPVKIKKAHCWFTETLTPPVIGASIPHRFYSGLFLCWMAANKEAGLDPPPDEGVIKCESRVEAYLALGMVAIAVDGCKHFMNRLCRDLLHNSMIAMLTDKSFPHDVFSN